MEPMTIAAILGGLSSMGGNNQPYVVGGGNTQVMQQQDPMKQLGGLAQLYGLGNQAFSGFGGGGDWGDTSSGVQEVLMPGFGGGGITNY